MFDKAKMVAQALKLKKAVEREMTVISEDGIEVTVSGDLKIKKLVVNGSENRVLVEVLNKAIKKSQEGAAKKMQEMGGLGDLF